VISRALVELFRRPVIASQVAMRGGTALHKLFFDPPGRYSEDIDLVQREPSPIGPLADAIRTTLDPWLGEPRWSLRADGFILRYRFDSTFAPVVRMRVKLEINTREQFTVLGLTARELAVENPWFSGTSDIVTYSLPELLGTKLRALYQRKKGRDLFDLAVALDHPEFAAADLLAAFDHYMNIAGTPVTRAQFEANMAA
jgi:predicted nucleotidyltransferase component of viral defense system